MQNHLFDLMEFCVFLHHVLVRRDKTPRGSFLHPSVLRLYVCFVWIFVPECVKEEPPTPLNATYITHTTGTLNQFRGDMNIFKLLEDYGAVIQIYCLGDISLSK